MRLGSRGELASITGDFVHHPVQVATPEWCSRFDTDQVQSERTRREFVGAHADSDLLLIGTDFGGPCSGRIRSTVDGHVFAAAG